MLVRKPFSFTGLSEFWLRVFSLIFLLHIQVVIIIQRLNYNYMRPNFQGRTRREEGKHRIRTEHAEHCLYTLDYGYCF